MAQREITQARAHETRARILTGAAEAFAEHGFAGATIADIMTRSGVTKRALYFHFDTKEEVADAVLAAHTTWLRDAVAALAGSPVQRLVDYGYLTCDGLADDPIFQATARLAIERETYGAGRRASFGVWEETTRDMLDEVAAAGCLNAGVDTGVVARMLSAAVLGLHLSAQASDPSSRLHAEIEQFWTHAGATLVRPEALAGVTLRRARLTA